MTRDDFPQRAISMHMSTTSACERCGATASAADLVYDTSGAQLCRGCAAKKQISVADSSNRRQKRQLLLAVGLVFLPSMALWTLLAPGVMVTVLAGGAVLILLGSLSAWNLFVAGRARSDPSASALATGIGRLSWLVVGLVIAVVLIAMLVASVAG